MSKVRNDRRASITITFDSPTGALGWFEKAQDAGLLQHEAALFQKDGLDDLVGDTGVPGGNDFIVRRYSDRPNGRIKRSDHYETKVVVSTR